MDRDQENQDTENTKHTRTTATMHRIFSGCDPTFWSLSSSLNNSSGRSSRLASFSRIGRSPSFVLQMSRSNRDKKILSVELDFSRNVLGESVLSRIPARSSGQLFTTYFVRTSRPISAEKDAPKESYTLDN